MLTDRLRNRFGFDAALVTIGMSASIVTALALATLMAAQQLIAASRVPIIKLQATRLAPKLTLAPHHHWHLFLSHIWGTGQDQMVRASRRLVYPIRTISNEHSTHK